METNDEKYADLCSIIVDKPSFEGGVYLIASEKHILLRIHVPESHVDGKLPSSGFLIPRALLPDKDTDDDNAKWDIALLPGNEIRSNKFGKKPFTLPVPAPPTIDWRTAGSMVPRKKQHLKSAALSMYLMGVDNLSTLLDVAYWLRLEDALRFEFNGLEGAALIDSTERPDVSFLFMPWMAPKK